MRNLLNGPQILDDAGKQWCFRDFAATKNSEIPQPKHTFLTQPWQLPRLRETGGWQLRLKFAMAAGA
jgi:hypothetical protein